MKILVFSDSHAGLSFMRYCVARIKPSALIHLGDYFDDGEILHEENIHLPFMQVAGNCDRYRTPPSARETVCFGFCGIRIFMTHGHLHYVKNGIGALIADARKYNTDIVLYGHTHKAYCEKDSDGLWIMNPGHCGTWGGSAGVIEVENGIITACYIIQHADLEGYK